MPQSDDPAFVALVYRELVQGSLMPSEPARIALAAVSAIARHHGKPAPALPAGFGSDLDHDAAWLQAQLPEGGPWWEVLRAMAWQADKPHTGVSSPAMSTGMAAIVAGRPLTSPGFFLWRQSDGRLAVADIDMRGSGFASGLRAGAVLESVDDTPARRSSSQVLPFYAAAPGSEFDLVVERAGERRQLTLRLEAADVPGVVHELDDDGVGYLKLRWFASSDDETVDTAALASSAIDQMVAAGARGLVIDVRSGLGGALPAVLGIASALCRDQVITATSSLDGPERTFERVGEPLWLDRPLAVVINEQTISAAEYLAIALEECAGARLIGTATSGGLNSIREVPLADGYKLVLPGRMIVGPRSREPRPGHRLIPHESVPNPSSEELASGRDPQLAAARSWVLS